MLLTTDYEVTVPEQNPIIISINISRLFIYSFSLRSDPESTELWSESLQKRSKNKALKIKQENFHKTKYPHQSNQFNKYDILNSHLW